MSELHTEAATAPAEATHGGIDFRELERLGLSPAEVIDFSATVNPFGPSPNVQAAVNSTRWDAYPDRECFRLRETIAERYDIEPDNILVGNGVSELLHLIAATQLSKDDVSLIVEPTYGEYRRVSQLAGTRIVGVRAASEAGFEFPVQEIAEHLDTESPRVAFLCRPNNPTGVAIDIHQVDEWTLVFPETIFVIDEAYLDFHSESTSCLTLQRENLIVLRSLTKAYALAGLRVGYAVGPAHLLEEMKGHRIPWSVNAIAQSAATAALDDSEHLERTLIQLKQVQTDLLEELRSLEFPLFSRTPGFFLIKTGNAAHWRSELLKRRCLIRDCTSFGLPEFLRISPRTPKENRKLVAALQDIAGSML